jgi:hypothetical protein
MAKIERFEDLISWQKARELNRLVYQVQETNGRACTTLDLGLWTNE